MRIQHNIMAMNAYRNYNNNTSALSKNLEKLSSGYKINRAGDDAAGLAISEKMRAQITGLKAASKNVKDGVSLVKTAEGALQEVHDMLNRMDSLATQSANGTYENEVDRANLQKEVTALKSEIDRIADSSNFNGLKLLDGSLGEGKIDVSAAKIGATPVVPTTNAATGAESTFGVDPATKDGDPYTMKVEYLDASGKSHTVDVKYTGDNGAAKDNGAAMQKALAAKQEVAGIEKSIRDVEAAVETKRTYIGKMKTLQSNTRKNEEYQMCIQEVEKTEAAIDSLETSELELMERLETAKTDMEQKIRRARYAQRELEETLARFDRTAETDKELLNHLNAERADLAAAVPENSLGEYERMTRSKGVPVIVPMDEKGHCGCCHMVITDNARMKVLGGHETVYCDSCHRILH